MAHKLLKKDFFSRKACSEFPDEEGIETALRTLPVQIGGCSEFPDEEGLPIVAVTGKLAGPMMAARVMACSPPWLSGNFTSSPMTSPKTVGVRAR